MSVENGDPRHCNLQHTNGGHLPLHAILSNHRHEHFPILFLTVTYCPLYSSVHVFLSSCYWLLSLSILPNSQDSPNIVDRRYLALSSFEISQIKRTLFVEWFLVIADNRFRTIRWRNSQVSQVDQYTSCYYTLNSTQANMDHFTMDCLSDTKAYLSWEEGGSWITRLVIHQSRKPEIREVASRISGTIQIQCRNTWLILSPR